MPARAIRSWSLDRITRPGGGGRTLDPGLDRSIAGRGRPDAGQPRRPGRGERRNYCSGAAGSYTWPHTGIWSWACLIISGPDARGSCRPAGAVGRRRRAGEQAGRGARARSTALACDGSQRTPV